MQSQIVIVNKEAINVGSTDGLEKVKTAQHSSGRVATHGSFREQRKELNTSVSPTVNVILPESVKTGFKPSTKGAQAKKQRGKSAKSRPIKPLKKGKKSDN